MMEQKDIYELISVFDGSSLTELEIENASFRLHLSRNLQGGEPYKAAGGAALPQEPFLQRLWLRRWQRRRRLRLCLQKLPAGIKAQFLKR